MMPLNKEINKIIINSHPIFFKRYIILNKKIKDNIIPNLLVKYKKSECGPV